MKALMTTVDELIADLEAIDDRAQLVGFLAPLRVPDYATNEERADLTTALIKAAGRCWHKRGDRDE